MPIYTFGTRRVCPLCHDECQNVNNVNSCKVALGVRRYNKSHDGVRALVDTVMKNIAKGVLWTANLQDGYNYPSHIA